ncbi:branched-chain amino acid ABC transporter permease [Cryobacterium tepidiphilum]|uniref:branched-chain amino acid ABC transporter permease n=1 Tax=Cryobacterium tepidiphilum TaxID=2486026 RepID=UPI001313F57D|nr:branched-chain amino acid ABC transporter permease [Cryobacterium tepidiphilum]
MRSLPTSRPWRIAFYLVALAALFLAPVYLQSSYSVRILVLVCLFGAASTGWNLIGGYANQISLGHTVFFGIGAYATVIFQGTLGLSPWLAIPTGIVLAVIVALLIGWPTFQLSGHYFALATLALLPVFHIIATYWEDLTGGSVGISVPILPSGLDTLQFDTPTPFFYIAAVLLVLVMILARWVRQSVLGLQLDAIRLNPQASTLAGVNQFRAKMKALVMSAAVVAVAGSLYGAFLQFMDPDTAFSWNTTLNLVLFAMVGGVRFWWGPALGALILIPFGEFASAQLTGNLAALGQLAYGVLLILLVLFQPRGIGGLFSIVWQKATGRKL